VSDDPPDPRLAERLTRAARAAQALSETLWEALQEELADPRPERVAELSGQLGEVASVVASLARVDARVREQPAEPANGGPVERESQVPRATTYGGSSSEAPAPSREPPEVETSPTPAVLVDELAAGTRPREGDPPRKARPEIEIRDERSTEGPAAWIDSIGRRLERYEQEGAPFAVLLVELVDLERLRHAEPAEELSRLMGLLEDALAHVLRPADALTRERPGRYWLLAPQTDGPGARVLVERIVRAVRSSASHRGTPLEVAVGVAVCPEDGRSASELAAHADVELYAARAAGRPSIG
jgi:GGDEF domain-containing protein